MLKDRHDSFGREIESTEIAQSDIVDLDIYAAYKYWDDLRKGAIGPTQRQYKLEVLPPKLIPRMAIVDFIGPPQDYFYRFFGTAMAEAAGQELSGKFYIRDKIEGYGFVNARLFPIMIETRKPMFHRTVWESVKGVLLQTTSLRLPLSNDAQTVTGAVTANVYSFA
jgi:hypothetical protein